MPPGVTIQQDPALGYAKWKSVSVMGMNSGFIPIMESVTIMTFRNPSVSFIVKRYYPFSNPSGKRSPGGSPVKRRWSLVFADQFWDVPIKIQPQSLRPSELLLRSVSACDLASGGIGFGGLGLPFGDEATLRHDGCTVRCGRIG